MLRPWAEHLNRSVSPTRAGNRQVGPSPRLPFFPVARIGNSPGVVPSLVRSPVNGTASAASCRSSNILPHQHRIIDARRCLGNHSSAGNHDAE